MDQSVRLLLRVLATAWFAISLAIACSGVCSLNLLGRLFLLLFVRLPRGREAYDLALARWAGTVMAGGAVVLCCTMSPIWRVVVVENVAIEPSPLKAEQRAPNGATCASRRRSPMTPESGESTDSEGSRASTAPSSPNSAASLSEEANSPSSRIMQKLQTTPVKKSGLCSIMLYRVMPAFFMSENSLPRGPSRAIIMCNHLGNADGFILRASTAGWASGLKMIYKASLDNIPIFGWAFRLTGDLSVMFRSSAMDDFSVQKGTVGPMMLKAHEHIDNKRMTIAVFPEGARSSDGNMKPFRDGFFRLAVENGFDIYANALVGSREAWTPGSTLLNFATIHVVRSNEPISSRGKTVESLKAEVADAISALSSNFLKQNC